MRALGLPSPALGLSLEDRQIEEGSLEGRTLQTATGGHLSVSSRVIRKRERADQAETGGIRLASEARYGSVQYHAMGAGGGRCLRF